MTGSYQGTTFQQLRVEVRDHVAFVTLDNPPVNIIGAVMAEELSRLADLIDADPDVRVAVFKSDIPDFFSAHADVAVVLTLSSDRAEERAGVLKFGQAFTRVRDMKKATIGQIDGRARGGGNELLLCFDLRYASTRSLFAQIEVTTSLMPGGGGTQRLTRLVGRANALEIMLTGDDFSGEAAERIGLINRALPADKLAAYVEGVASRIALFDPEAVRRIKESVDLAERPIDDGLAGEAVLFKELATVPATVAAMTARLAKGAPNRDDEMDAGQSQIPDALRSVRVGMPLPR